MQRVGRRDVVPVLHQVEELMGGELSQRPAASIVRGPDQNHAVRRIGVAESARTIRDVYLHRGGGKVEAERTIDRQRVLEKEPELLDKTRRGEGGIERPDQPDRVRIEIGAGEHVLGGGHHSRGHLVWSRLVRIMDREVGGRVKLPDAGRNDPPDAERLPQARIGLRAGGRGAKGGDQRHRTRMRPGRPGRLPRGEVGVEV